MRVLLTVSVATCGLLPLITAPQETQTSFSTKPRDDMILQRGFTLREKAEATHTYSPSSHTHTHTHRHTHTHTHTHIYRQ